MDHLPAYHPEWLIKFWFGTPGLNKLEPHLTLFIALIVLLLFFYKKSKSTNSNVIDIEEEVFKQLLTRRQVIEQQIVELDVSYEQNKLPEDQYKRKRTEFQKLLEQTRQELRQYTI
ncbi:hypothetical protein [Bacillus sp. B15-48]|uniref:hypothetical protein n=1 Tax=Bacillus sp. B15-48 TaxID=1548601 RepID=UPI00193ED5CA|nr:hypothetical protein [Bacillus sp. B15-48]MBM4762629.1 hypothetical protein [Bacillus sp. B15-48]